MSATNFGEQEYGDANLGYGRRTKRLVGMANAAIANPSASFPKMMGTDAELEGTYRFLNHPHVRPEQILAPHIRQTAHRCSSEDVVWVPHDTTSLVFNGEHEREGLGRVKNKKQGFDAHFTIAVRPGSKQMLGVLGLQRINTHQKKPRGSSGRTLAKGESTKWEMGVESAMKALPCGPSMIHLMDREADSYGLWSFLVQRQQRFAIRLFHNRRLNATQKLFQMLDDLNQKPALLRRQVKLSRRGREGGSTLRKIHPPRAARQAELEVRACSVSIPKTDYRYSKDDPDTLSLNIVHVREPNPPLDCQPVDWKLITTEPVETTEQLEAIIDAYRARWVIEEYFKALKTGCAIEKRQLDSYEGLAMALALLAPVAWRLFQLKSLAEATPEASVETLLTPIQLKLLRLKARDPFPQNPTISDALFAMARLGGFLKHNKKPGWQVIGRGFHDLLLLEQGWSSALTEIRCDQ